MGVKRLTALLARFAPSCISMPAPAAISGWTVAIDSNIFVQRFFRTPQPVNPGNAAVKDNSKRHLRGMYNLGMYAKSIDVTPVFVFDGQSRLDEKSEELSKRRKERKRIRKEHQQECIRALRIGIMERIAVCLLDDQIEVSGITNWTVYQHQHQEKCSPTATPEYPVFISADKQQSSVLHPNNIYDIARAADSNSADRSDYLQMYTGNPTVPKAITWLQSQVEEKKLQQVESAFKASVDVLANKRIKKSTINSRMDDLERQIRQGLLFRLGALGDSDYAGFEQDTSHLLSMLRQLSNHRLSALACRGESLMAEHVEECRQLVAAMGYATYTSEAGMESECVCAQLTRTGVADAVCSEDLDVLAFGGQRLLRGFFGMDPDSMMLIDHKRMLGELGLTREQFLDLCILCGTDYSSTIEKVGPITALKLIQSHGSIESILATGKYREREGFRFELAREVFNSSGQSCNVPFWSRDQVRWRPCPGSSATVDMLLPLAERDWRSKEESSDPFAPSAML